jgi:hypothetical protein
MSISGQFTIPPRLALGRVTEDADLKAARPTGGAVARLAGMLVEGVAPNEGAVVCARNCAV